MKRKESVLEVVFVVVGVAALASFAPAQECPQLLGTWGSGQGVYHVAAEAGYAYTVTGDGWLRVVDLRTPSAPVEVGSLEAPMSNVTVAGDFAYTFVKGFWSLEVGYLHVIDVSTPSAPVLMGAVELGFFQSMEGAVFEVSGSYAYVVRHSLQPPSGLAVVDVSNPWAPVEVGSLHLDDAGDVAVAGRYAYVVGVAAGGSGLWVIDVGTPSAPVAVGFVVTPSPLDVAVAGRYAYVAAGGSGLRVIDLGDPSAPVEVGSVEFPGGSAVTLAVAGGYAYVEDWDGLRVVDVSTPTAPVAVAFYPLQRGGVGVAVSDGYVLLASGEAGLFVFDGCGLFVDGFESGDTSAWSGTDHGGLVVALPGGVEMAFKYLPAGTFRLGSPVGERGRFDREDLHWVTLTQGYYLGRTEVTQAQWEAVMGAPMPTQCGSYGVGPDYPVYCVSWDDVAGPGGFVERLNTYLGTTAFRLPTDAEWERAARAGNQHRFSHGDVLECDDACGACATHDPYMWWCGSQPYNGTSQPVGSRLPNEYGLFDMHGNVIEWVQDWYAAHLGIDPVTDPTGPATGYLRVVRGGFWGSHAQFCRSAYRYSNDPDARDVRMGFRLAMTAP